MFKPRRNLIRKCRENRKFTDRDYNRTKKQEGNSIIPSKRLTIPPRSLYLGITSGTVKRTSGQQNNNPQREYILKEDLRGLLNNNCNNISKPRRSTRILKKVEETQNLNDLIASDYYSKILIQDTNPPDNNESLNWTHKNRFALKNSSKSLFREINKRCSRTVSQNSVNLKYPVNPISVTKAEFQENLFCKNLLKEVCIHLNHNYLLDLQLSISQKIQDINNILSGKPVPKSEMDEDNKKNKNNAEIIDKEETLKNFTYIPRDEWVYETPPRQRVMPPKVDVCAIKTAVIYTVKKQSNIYEVNPNIRMDVNNYTNRQNVEVDGRYLKHLGTFENKMQIDCDLNSLKPRYQVNIHGGETSIDSSYNYFQRQEECPHAKYNFENPFLNVPENQFIPVLSRPKKTVQRVPLTSNILKRRLEKREGISGCSDQHELDENFEGDFTFIEDNGKFKIVSTQSSVEENQFGLPFEQNLFKSCEEGGNPFRFRKEEQNLFTFSQL